MDENTQTAPVETPEVDAPVDAPVEETPAEVVAPEVTPEVTEDTYHTDGGSVVKDEYLVQ